MATPSGILELGELAPGAHVGQLYRDRQDLLDTLIPYFAAGLAGNERCIWVTSQPLCAADARAALAARVPDLAERERAGQIDIFDHADWYTRKGALGPDAVIQGWLDAEVAALAAGYAGLRVSGNTFWLEPSQLAEFVEYEARVHAAFKGRKIVALCSYALERCESHAIVDVLSNHSISMIRQSRGWSVVHGATAALASLEPAPAHARSHTVEFFTSEFPAARIAARLASALENGHAAAVLAGNEHAGQLRAALARDGIAVDVMTAAKRLAFIDADAVFAAAARPEGIDLAAIDTQVLRPILELLAGTRHVVAYGELVDLFAQHGDPDGALLLERWWNEQLARYSISLACGYSLAAFGTGDAVATFRHVCDAHTAVRVDAATGDGAADRLRAELAQVTHVLAAEMARREVLESAYEAARAGREQLVRLERLAAALGEVTTLPELTQVVSDVVVATLGADTVLVVEADSHPGAEPLVRHGPDVEALSELAQTTNDRTLWSPDGAVLRGPSVLHAVALLPLQANARRLGTCIVGFASPRPFNASYRALVQDVVRQLALALDRCKTYERLEHERARAESASRAKDEFLAMLGHELRNPLSPILTATQLMRMRGGDSGERERTVIERQVKHMIRLVDDLLDVSRITRGKVELRRRPIEIAEIVSQAAELASPALEERLHRFEMDVPTTGIVVHADAQRLTQVVSNLLMNAAKYTPPGGAIRLAVTTTRKSVAVTVTDNGTGIDGKLLPHIFDLFVQGRQGLDRASGGLGLGLAIARSICEMHGGAIRAHSDGPSCGSEFTIELPRYANTRPHARSTSGGFVLPTAPRRRVLVVDDNEDAAFLFSEALKRLGHHVEVAHDGLSALERAKENPPEVAFLDIGLPVMDGYELGRRLRELSNPPRLIAVTGYGASSDREKSREAGFEQHLVKPIELTAVQDALAKIG